MNGVKTEKTIVNYQPHIVVLLGVPFTEQNYKRTGVAYLEHHFEVTVIDCNKWLYPDYALLNYQRHSYIDRIEVASMEALQRLIASVKPDFAIDCLNVSPMKQQIRLELFRRDIPFVVRRTGLFPHLPRKKLLIHLLRYNPTYLFQRLKQRLTKLGDLTRTDLSPDIALLAGRSRSKLEARPRLLEIAIADDDVHFLREARLKWLFRPVPQRKAILFLDDCIAEAKDYLLTGLPIPMDVHKYYALLRKSFDIVEQVFACKVVVAAHPDGLHIPGYVEKFGPRDVRFGQTAGLALEAKLVIGHASTALSFAIMEKIPIVLLSCRELHSSFKGAHILAMQHAIKAPLVFMEDEGEQLVSACRGARVDDVSYQNYIEEFLMMPGTKEEQPWGAFINYVNFYAKTNKQPCQSTRN